MIKFTSEKILEDFIVDHFNKTGMCIVTDEEYDSVHQQYNIGTYGIPDLVFTSKDEIPDENGNLNEHFEILVVELKNELLSYNAIAQISRYKSYFEDALYDVDNVNITYALVTPKHEKSIGEIDWLISNVDGIEMVEFELDPYSGVKFSRSPRWGLPSFDSRYGLNLIKEGK